MFRTVMADPKTEVAILAGGCFWCLEAVFLGGRRAQRASGYIGGHVDAPSYERVSAMATPATPRRCASSSTRR
jgi:peptide methionine sulfoxide reductase MsrA